MRGRVVWVVDGDTIHVRVGPRLEKGRYIGVNAPEVPHPGARGWREGGAAKALGRRTTTALTSDSSVPASPTRPVPSSSFPMGAPRTAAVSHTVAAPPRRPGAAR